VKTTLKSERIKQAPRRRFTSRQRTSRFMGVGSSNRKNQWQVRGAAGGRPTQRLGGGRLDAPLWPRQPAPKLLVTARLLRGGTTCAALCRHSHSA
jgi:hypothetical protein